MAMAMTPIMKEAKAIKNPITMISRSGRIENDVIPFSASEIIRV